MRRTMLRGAAVVLLLGAWAGSAGAAYEFYMHVEGIQGSATTSGFQNWIPCVSFTHELEGLAPANELVQNPRVANQTLGAGGITLLKTLDKSSVHLFSLCGAGQRRPIKFALMSTVGDKRIILTFEMKNVLVEHILLCAPGFGDRANLLRPVAKTKPIEELRLNFEEVKWTVTEQPIR